MAAGGVNNSPGTVVNLNLPQPPQTYNQSFFSQLIRTIWLNFNQLQAQGPAYFATLNLSNLPTNPNGLPVGSVYVYTNQGGWGIGGPTGGILMIVLANIAYAPTFDIVFSEGTVVATGH